MIYLTKSVSGPRIQRYVNEETFGGIPSLDATRAVYTQQREMPFKRKAKLPKSIRNNSRKILDAAEYVPSRFSIGRKWYFSMALIISIVSKSVVV